MSTKNPISQVSPQNSSKFIIRLTLTELKHVKNNGGNWFCGARCHNFVTDRHEITLTLHQATCPSLVRVRRKRQKQLSSIKSPYGTSDAVWSVQRKMWRQQSFCPTDISLQLKLSHAIIFLHLCYTTHRSPPDLHLLWTALNPEAICLFVSTQQAMRHDVSIIWSARGLNSDTQCR